MKNILSLFALTILGIGLMAQTSTLRCTLTDFENPQVYVFEIQNGQVQPRDTIIPNAKGEFRMSFNLESEAMFLLKFNVERSSDVHLMILPKEKITMDLHLDKKHHFVEVAKVSGSKNMELYSKFNHILHQNLDTIMSINQEFQDKNTTDKRKLHLADAYQILMAEQNIAIKKILENYSDQVLAAFLVTYFDQDYLTYLPLYEKVRDALKPHYPMNPFVMHLDQKIAASLKTGSMAPEITMKDPNGNERKLSSLRGKIVMIDFWASWCRPCRMENPNVVKLYKKYHDAGFDIFSVSLDKNKGDWVRAIAADGLEWENHVSDLQGWTSSGGAAYNVTSVPCTVLIDKEGRILAKNLRGAELERKLKEIFGF